VPPVLTKILKGFKGLVGLLIPVFARGREKTASPGFRWAVHIGLVVLTLIGLWVAQRVFELEKFVATGAPPWVRENWLPLLFALVYALGWLIWWLWTLLQAAPEASAFPDIDRAWEEAKLALSEGNLNLGEVPLFLILGQPEGGEEPAFSSLTLAIGQSPRRPEAPLHVYAAKDAIYITCPGASLLGAQSRVLSGELRLASPQDVPGGTSDENKTLQIGGSVGEILGRANKRAREIEERAKAEGRGPGQLTAAERLEIKRSDRELAKLAQNRFLHAFPEEVDLIKARLRHLCRLIARDRRPFCGINGVLALIPMTATDDDQDAHETGTCLKEDLEIIRDTLQVECPVFSLICGLEELPGFDKFIAKVPPDQLRRRVGQRLPLVPDLPPEKIPRLIESAVKWLGLKMLPSLALPAWILETPGVVDPSEAVGSNAELYRFLSEVRERQARASKILSLGVTGQLLGGGYLAATGKNSDRERAFLRPVFARLSEEQDYVAWTPEAIAEDESYQRIAKIGYIALAVAAIVEVAILIFRFTSR
jgi:hypothetical protein